MKEKEKKEKEDTSTILKEHIYIYAHQTTTIHQQLLS